MDSATPPWMVPPGIAFPLGPGAPGTPGPPGIVQSTQVPPNFPRGPVTPDSSSMFQRPSMPLLTGPLPPGSALRPQTGAPYQSLPAMAAPHQGHWLQPPPQMGGVFRPPNMPYAAATFPGPPFPSMTRGIAPAIPVPDSQPPGVTPVNTGAVQLSSSAAVMHQMVGSSAMRTELHYSGDRAHGHDIGGQVASVVNEHSDAWTAHKSEAGVVYYYNALTGESTYKKPSDYKGESEKVSVQPVPVSMVNLPGTDWVLVNTSDGKKYYYNSKTKVSSWQIPNEVSELRKKQESDISKETPMSVPNGNVVAEKGSTPPSLNAPAINTGGRDAMPLRPVTSQTSASALDLIKKKLQEFGSSVTASQPVMVASESNGSRAVEAATKGHPSENSKDKLEDGSGDGNVSDSSSDSEDADSGPTKEECIIQFKEMLKDRGVAPFSKWDKELPKFVFDPRFKAIPSYSTRRTLFEHFVKTRVEEERKEKRAAQKVAVEGFKQLLDEVSEDIDLKTDYQSFRKKWGDDPRFSALERKDREHLLNERVLPLKRAAEEKAQAIRTAFKSMLKEKGDITLNSRWSRVKDSLRDDPRYRSVNHEDREVLFNEYLSDLRSAKDEVEREAKAKRDEQDKLKERERELRKRKEREEHEMERVRVKVRRKEAVVSFQALLMESIKDPLASWTESKPRLDKDPQGRSSNSDLDLSEMEKLFREHIKMLQDRSARDYKSLLAETLTGEAATRETEDGKTALNSWSTAKRLLKSDHRYNKMPRKDRETLWYRFAEDFLRKQTSDSNPDPKDEKTADFRNKSSVDSSRVSTGSRR